jgi:hypothetical protein
MNYAQGHEYHLISFPAHRTVNIPATGTYLDAIEGQSGYKDHPEPRPSAFLINEAPALYESYRRIVHLISINSGAPFTRSRGNPILGPLTSVACSRPEKHLSPASGSPGINYIAWRLYVIYLSLCVGRYNLLSVAAPSPADFAPGASRAFAFPAESP